jgi:maltose alpha-D-glucosyltransferase/alpha-amylase
MPSVDEPTVERLGLEQSNTSVLIGEDMILKALRRLQPGIHPEVEIGRFLTDVAGFRNAPPLLGSVEMVDAGGEPTAIAVLQGFVRNQGDGWSFTLDYLDRVLGQLEMVPTSIEVNQEDLHAMFRALSQTLGTRIGELHQAFALAVDDPAFRPESVTESDVATWKSLIRQQAAQAQAALQRVFETGTIGADVRFDVETLLGRWAEVDRTIEAALPTVPQVKKTRLHGDMHLGQVVVVRDDFYILDFEGEPLRSMDQRRAKHSPLRDVAGMLRSFSYVARTALQQRGNHRPEMRRQLDRAIDEWERQMIGAFIESYRAAAAGCPSIPVDDATFQRLLHLFLLEKALYEICYEATNRPDWIAIPLYGVLRLLSQRAP